MHQAFEDAYDVNRCCLEVDTTISKWSLTCHQLHHLCAGQKSDDHKPRSLEHYWSIQSNEDSITMVNEIDTNSERSIQSDSALNANTACKLLLENLPIIGSSRAEIPIAGVNPEDLMNSILGSEDIYRTVTGTPLEAPKSADLKQAGKRMFALLTEMAPKELKPLMNGFKDFVDKLSPTQIKDFSLNPPGMKMELPETVNVGPLAIGPELDFTIDPTTGTLRFKKGLNGPLGSSVKEAKLAFKNGQPGIEATINGPSLGGFSLGETKQFVGLKELARLAQRQSRQTTG